MKLFSYIYKVSALSLIRIAWFIKPGLGTRMYARFLKSCGAKIEGTPNYLSAKIWFDSTDYGLISLGKGCTISSNVRVLTHDWALHTIAKEFGLDTGSAPLGRRKPVKIGRNVFVGTGSIIMPGADIGAGSIIGAGTVVRGVIPAFSIVIGNPGTVIGSSKDYLYKQIK